MRGGGISENTFLTASHKPPLPMPFHWGVCVCVWTRTHMQTNMHAMCWEWGGMANPCQKKTLFLLRFPVSSCPPPRSLGLSFLSSSPSHPTSCSSEGILQLHEHSLLKGHQSGQVKERQGEGDLCAVKGLFTTPRVTILRAAPACYYVERISVALLLFFY